MPQNRSLRTRPDTAASDAASALANLRQHALRARARAALGGILIIVVTALATAAATHQKKTEVVAAARNLPADHIIRTADITVREVAAADAPRHALTSTAQAVGRRLVGPIAQMDALSRERVAAGPAARADALDMTLGVDAATARALAPGDSVDVWVVAQPTAEVPGSGARRAAHSVRVVAVYADRESTATESVTLSVPAADVPALVAARAEGAAVLLTRRP